MEAQKKKKQQRRKPTAKNVDSTFVDRLSSLEDSSERPAGARYSSANDASAAEGSSAQQDSEAPDSPEDPFIALMGGTEQQQQQQPQRPQSGRDRRAPKAAAGPSTVHAVLRSPFYEVTHNAALGLAGGKPGEGPKHVEETDLILHGGRVLHSCFDETTTDRRSVTARMIRFADCGIFGADQLAHTLATRTTPGFQIPQRCVVRGRSVLLSELLITCCSECTLENPGETNTELAQLYQRLLDDSNTPTIPRGAPLATETMPWVSPPLALALFAVQRLDLQAALVRANVSTPRDFLKLSDVEAHGEGSILQLPINLQLRETGDRMLVTDDITRIRQQLVPSQSAKMRALDGCLLAGTEGVNWSTVPSLVSKGVRRSLREVHDDARTGDVCYIPGQIPLVIGLQSGSKVGGNVESCWENQGNARCPRVVELLESGRGTVGLTEGARIVSERGDVRGTLTSDASADDQVLRYILDGSSRRDFTRNDWIFESTKHRWEKIRQGDDPIAFWRVAAQPELDEEAETAEEEQSIVALADALVERLVETVGGCPHIVLCRLDLDKVACSNPLSAATKGLRGQAILRARTAWQNYHALIEVAKQRMTASPSASSGGSPSSKRGVRRGGCGDYTHKRTLAPISLGLSNRQLYPDRLRSAIKRKKPKDDEHVFVVRAVCGLSHWNRAVRRAACNPARGVCRGWPSPAWVRSGALRSPLLRHWCVRQHDSLYHSVPVCVCV